MNDPSWRAAVTARSLGEQGVCRHDDQVFFIHILFCEVKFRLQFGRYGGH